MVEWAVFSVLAFSGLYLTSCMLRSHITFCSGLSCCCRRFGIVGIRAGLHWTRLPQTPASRSWRRYRMPCTDELTACSSSRLAIKVPGCSAVPACRAKYVGSLSPCPPKSNRKQPSAHLHSFILFPHHGIVGFFCSGRTMARCIGTITRSQDFIV